MTSTTGLTTWALVHIKVLLGSVHTLESLLHVSRPFGYSAGRETHLALLCPWLSFLGWYFYTKKRQPLPNARLRWWRFGLAMPRQTQATFPEYELPLMFIDGLENWLAWQILKPHVPWVGVQGDGAQCRPQLGSPEWPPYSSEAMENFETLVPGGFCW